MTGRDRPPRRSSEDDKPPRAGAGSARTDGGDPDPETGIAGAVERALPAALMARRNLARNRLRSGLAALGIVIGVFAIVTLGIFGTTIQSAASSNLGDVGSSLTVQPATNEGVENITSRDVDKIRRAASGSATVPVRTGRGIASRGQEESIITVYGVDKPGPVLEADSGEIPDRLRGRAIVSSGLADRFGLEVGNSITVNDDNYRVAGTVEPSFFGGGLSVFNGVVIASDNVEGDTWDQVIVAAESGEEASATADEIEEAVNGREERVTVTDPSEIVGQIQEFLTILQTTVVGLGGISLIVAGVSILNVMLMSTVERREEIGVFRAVGVHKRDIMKIILFEAGLLGLAGGVVGTLLAVVAGTALNSYAIDDPMATFQLANLWYVLGGIGFAVMTSLLSGLYPAWKAANERPVEALRD